MAATATAATDEQLVAAIRDGSDEALEALFLRYKDRIAAYVRGIVPDQGKAEDIVQETFISALRSLRSSRRPIAFRPWIYQIARNACIDQLRRQKRTQEVSIDSEAFNPHDEGRISQAGPSTHGAVSQREDMHTLQQAFGGLPSSQYEALVLRELEGRSYTEIASRMNLSAAAVESMLFRARRGLKDEYDEIATGERCVRMQPLIAAVAEGLGGARDREALGRHVRFCASCRRGATAMGLRSFVTEALRRGRIKRALHRAAALFPIPPFLLRRRGPSTTADASRLERLNARVQAPVSQLGVAGGPAAESAAGALPKAVAIVAAAALIGGGGFVGQKAGGDSASASPLAGASGGLSGPGLPGQPPALSSGQASPDPFGAAGGLAQSGGGSTLGQIVSAGQGGLIGLGAPGGAGGVAGPAGPTGPVETLLGGTGGLIGPGGPASQSPSGGRLGDTVKKAVPPALGGISLPQLPVGGSPSTGGGNGSNPGSIIDDIVPKLPNPPASGKPKTPSNPPNPNLPSVPPTPTVPALPQVPQVTPPNLQSTVPVPGLHQTPVTPPAVPGLPQLP